MTKAILVLNNINEENIEELRAKVEVSCYGKIIATYNNLGLREMPKEKEVPFADKLMFITELSKEDTYNIGKAEGYNKCLKDLLGGENEL